MTPLERRLAEFVDRAGEIERFNAILGNPDKPIIYVVGESGIGKSSLLARMMHECSVRGLRAARVEWTETRNPDYLAIMRALRDDLDARSFAPFTQLVNFYFDESVKVDLTINSGGEIHIAEGMTVTNSTVGDIAGVVLRDCMFVLPRRDLGVSANERKLRLTERFLLDLGAFAQAGPVVLFFDAVQKMTDETRLWMWEELMGAIREDRLHNLICVHFGWNRPTLDRDTGLITEVRELGPLQLDDIEDYLVKREVQCSSRRELAIMVLAVSHGRPIDVANTVDAFEAVSRSAGEAAR
jgi:hypothetical protein